MKENKKNNDSLYLLRHLQCLLIKFVVWLLVKCLLEAASRFLKVIIGLISLGHQETLRRMGIT